jgi:electron transfer flavoprotein alpha subunit
MNKILVFAEQRNGEIKKIALENISLARNLSVARGGDFVTVVVGWNIEPLASQLAEYGAGRIVLCQDQNLTHYNPEEYARIVSEIAEEESVDLIILGATAMGKDLAPRLSARLHAVLASDCIDLQWQDGELRIVRPMFAGKVRATVKINSQRKIVTVRPNIYRAQVHQASPQVLLKGIVAGRSRMQIEPILAAANQKLDVTEADIIVSGGRGMKGPENFHLITALAKKLGAAQGASRAVVDAGWRPYEEQVGQTGKTVSPTLYIAVGISGAIQHLAGMSSSRYIVAINKDPEAPIFKVADYGIIGDALEILPALIESV